MTSRVRGVVGKGGAEKGAQIPESMLTNANSGASIREPSRGLKVRHVLKGESHIVKVGLILE
jgi:hypothetical protein